MPVGAVNQQCYLQGAPDSQRNKGSRENGKFRVHFSQGAVGRVSLAFRHLIFLGKRDGIKKYQYMYLPPLGAGC